jgi:hypothetical protein
MLRLATAPARNLRALLNLLDYLQALRTEPAPAAAWTSATKKR